ncbi:MAG: hypothetical protein WCZ89_06200 [Phycisphaerae bacterium]
MIKKMILMLVLLTAISGGTVFYVNKSGSSTSPYDTAAKGATNWGLAYAAAKSAGGDDHIIRIIEGTYSANDETAKYLFLDGAIDIIFQGWKADDTGIADAANVTFTGLSGQTRVVRMHGSMTTKTATFKNLSLLGDNSAHIIRIEIDPEDEAKRPSLVIDNTIITPTANYHGIVVTADANTANPITNITVYDSAITCTGTAVAVLAWD